jgi:hypothetical protein
MVTVLESFLLPDRLHHSRRISGLSFPDHSESARRHADTERGLVLPAPAFTCILALFTSFVTFVLYFPDLPQSPDCRSSTDDDGHVMIVTHRFVVSSWKSRRDGSSTDANVQLRVFRSVDMTPVLGQHQSPRIRLQLSGPDSRLPFFVV